MIFSYLRNLLFILLTIVGTVTSAQYTPDILAQNLLDSSEVYEFSNPDSCLLLIQEAGKVLEPYSDELKYAWMTGRYHIFLGLYHNRTGSYQKAITNFQHSIDYFEKAMNVYPIAKKARKGIGSGYHNTGNVFSNMGNHNKAIELLEKAREIYIELGDSLYAAGSYVNIGSSYLEMDSLDKALDYYKISSLLFRKMNATYQLGVMTHNIGILYKRKNKMDSAIFYLNESKNIKEARSNIYGLSSIYYQLGEVYYLLYDYENSLSHFEKALDYSETSKNQKTKSHTYNYLAKTFQKMGDYEQAYVMLVKHDALEDSLFNEDNQKAILDAQEKYEVEKKELQLENQKKKAELVKAITYIVSAAALIIIILLINRLLAQRTINRISKDKFQTEMDYKNRLLTSKTIDLANFSSLLTDLDSKIDELKKESPDQLSKSLKKSINSSLREIDNWEHMKLHFEEVHPNFFRAISTLEPPLTPNEQKHFAFIKMKIENKDVARMLNVNLSSVHVVHHRIKKKLGLNEDESLAEFIDSFNLYS